MVFVGLGGNISATAVDVVQEPINELLWENVAIITLDMKFANGIITSTGNVVGRSGTTAIVALFVLARRNADGTFTEVDRWTATNGSIAMLLSTSRTTRNQPAGTYRLSVTAHVTRSGKTETVNASYTAALG